MKLNDEEKRLFYSVESGEWRSVENLEEEISMAREAAEATYVKDRRMNIRISGRDMNALKIRAREEGIPYQTLVSSIIHRYLKGRLVDRDND